MNNNNEEKKEVLDEETIVQEEVPQEESANAEEADEVSALRNQLLRLQADFENYKKRTQKERYDTFQLATEGLVTKLIPVLDNLDRVLDAVPEKKDGFCDGVLMVIKQISDILEAEGLKEIEAMEKQFDPNYHHGVAVGEDVGVEDQTITDVFQKGYIFKDKVIRPAMVKINQK